VHICSFASGTVLSCRGRMARGSLRWPVRYPALRLTASVGRDRILRTTSALPCSFASHTSQYPHSGASASLAHTKIPFTSSRASSYTFGAGILLICTPFRTSWGTNLKQYWRKMATAPPDIAVSTTQPNSPVLRPLHMAIFRGYMSDYACALDWRTNGSSRFVPGIVGPNFSSTVPKHQPPNQPTNQPINGADLPVLHGPTRCRWHRLHTYPKLTCLRILRRILRSHRAILGK
jgi:hypothetical protein